MFTVDAKQLKDVVTRVARSCAKDDSRPLLAGIHVKAIGTTLILQAADGFRLTRVTMDVKGTYAPLNASGTFNTKQLVAACKVVKGDVDIDFGHAGMTLASEHGLGHEVVSAIPGTFPDVDTIMPDTSELTCHTLSAQALRDALAPMRTGLVKKDACSAHLFTVDNRSYAVTATGTQYGRYSRWLTDETAGELAHLISFDPRYMLDALRDVKGSVTVYVKNKNSALMLQHEHVTHLIMAMIFKEDDLPMPTRTLAPEPDRVMLESAIRQSARRTVQEGERQANGTYVPTDGLPTCHVDGCNQGVYANGTCLGHLDMTQAQARVQAKREARKAETDASRCPTCGVPRGWYQGSRYCSICDAPAQDEKVADPAPAFAHNPHQDPTCPECGTVADPGDKFCAECGARISVTTNTAADAPASTDSLPGYVPISVKYHGKNPARILSAMPNATDVRGFHDWLKVGRCVMKGQHGIQIYSPAGTQGAGEDADGVIDDSPRFRVKKAYVFDVSQTQPIAPRDARTPARPAQVAA